MKSISFVPKACKGDAPMMAGSITLKTPNFDEKCDFQDIVGIDVDDEGNITRDKKGNMKVLREAVNLSKSFYLAVDLKKKDGTELKSFEDLSYDVDGHSILIEVASLYISGFRLGNG